MPIGHHLGNHNQGILFFRTLTNYTIGVSVQLEKTRVSLPHELCKVQPGPGYLGRQHLCQSKLLAVFTKKKKVD